MGRHSIGRLPVVLLLVLLYKLQREMLRTLQLDTMVAIAHRPRKMHSCFISTLAKGVDEGEQCYRLPTKDASPRPRPTVKTRT